MAAKLNAVYKGLALASHKGVKSYLYAANFRAGKIDVLDTDFHYVKLDHDDDHAFHWENVRAGRAIQCAEFGRYPLCDVC